MIDREGVRSHPTADVSDEAMIGAGTVISQTDCDMTLQKQRKDEGRGPMLVENLTDRTKRCEVSRIAVTFTDLDGYPTIAPFDPPEMYPELSNVTLNPDNQVYFWVRETLHHLGLDQNNFNTPHWNPLKDVVEPGMTVFIKPNTVRHNHLMGKDIFSVIVHASIIRPIMDYVCVALRNQGRIIIGDSQTIASDYDATMAVSQIDELIEWYRHHTPVPIECLDLRTHRAVRSWMYGAWLREPVAQDPQGYQFVDLGDQSFFRDIDPSRLRINVADHRNMYKHHSGGRHEYLIPRSVLESDAIINIPKMKTHRRTAVTLALKNLMGFPAWKDSLPHYRIGSIEEGGDQYIHSSLRKRVHTRLHELIQIQSFVPAKFFCALLKHAIWQTQKIVPFRDPINEAMWYGNDTLWRTLLDLYRAVFFSDKSGRICDTPQRQHFCFLDGIIGGEKAGPSSPDPVTPGVLMAGFDPTAFDAVAASLMGFDIEKIPMIQKGLEEISGVLPIDGNICEAIDVVDGRNKLTLAELQEAKNLGFEPHPNWKGHVERI